MSKVHILPPEVISKIAAGEVIERPASVVKELLENALDAGATSIDITLKDGGRTAITIKDNGSGIERDDLQNIFHRHATSKIRSADDLFDIHSLGFRGEALYSIGAVADVILKSKPAEQSKGPDTSTGSGPSASLGTGWEIHWRGGEELALKPCSFGISGTEIEIKELFFNTPARRKFLKSNTGEINQVLNTVIPYTLLYPQVRFRLTHQGKDLLDLNPAQQCKDRVAAALNLEAKHLMETKEDFADRHIGIHLVLGDVNITRARRDLQFIFVNGRPVQNKAVSYHLNQVTRLIMPDGCFPFFTAYLNVPAADVDVNIHPTKREVKIKDEQALCSLLRNVTEQVLMQQSGLKTVVRPASYVVSENQKTVERAFAKTNTAEVTFDAPAVTEADEGTLREPAADYAYPQEKKGPDPFFDNNTLHSKLANAVYVGPFRDKYLLFAIGSSLLVMDQHAAAERITYETLIRQMNNSAVEVQPLLAPVIVRLTPQELLIWEESQERLTEIGLETNQWDKENIAVHTQPPLLKNVEQAVRHILAGEKIAKHDFDTLARRACRSSVMAGDALAPAKAEAIRRQLMDCLDPFTCPHGRPTIIELTEDFLDKQFLRT